MDKVDEIGEQQGKHIAFTTAKLEAIEAQALKTNGRVTKVEDQVDIVTNRQENLATKVGAGVFVASTLFVYFINKVL